MSPGPGSSVPWSLGPLFIAAPVFEANRTRGNTRPSRQSKWCGTIDIELWDQEVSDVDDYTSETQTQATIRQTDGERLPNRELQGTWMSELDDSLFEFNKKRPKLAQKQKRENCQKYNEVAT